MPNDKESRAALLAPVSFEGDSALQVLLWNQGELVGRTAEVLRSRMVCALQVSLPVPQEVMPDQYQQFEHFIDCVNIAVGRLREEVSALFATPIIQDPAQLARAVEGAICAAQEKIRSHVQARASKGNGIVVQAMQAAAEALESPVTLDDLSEERVLGAMERASGALSAERFFTAEKPPKPVVTITFFHSDPSDVWATAGMGGEKEQKEERSEERAEEGAAFRWSWSDDELFTGERRLPHVRLLRMTRGEIAQEWHATVTELQQGLRQWQEECRTRIDAQQLFQIKGQQSPLKRDEALEAAAVRFMIQLGSTKDDLLPRFAELWNTQLTCLPLQITSMIVNKCSMESAPPLSFVEPTIQSFFKRVMASDAQEYPLVRREHLDDSVALFVGITGMEKKIRFEKLLFQKCIDGEDIQPATLRQHVLEKVQERLRKGDGESNLLHDVHTFLRNLQQRLTQTLANTPKRIIIDSQADLVRFCKNILAEFLRVIAVFEHGDLPTNLLAEIRNAASYHVAACVRSLVLMTATGTPCLPQDEAFLRELDDFYPHPPEEQCHPAQQNDAEQTDVSIPEHLPTQPVTLRELLAAWEEVVDRITIRVNKMGFLILAGHEENLYILDFEEARQDGIESIEDAFTAGPVGNQRMRKLIIKLAKTFQCREGAKTQPRLREILKGIQDFCVRETRAMFTAAAFRDAMIARQVSGAPDLPSPSFSVGWLQCLIQSLAKEIETHRSEQEKKLDAQLRSDRPAMHDLEAWQHKIDRKIGAAFDEYPDRMTLQQCQDIIALMRRETSRRPAGSGLVRTYWQHLHGVNARLYAELERRIQEVAADAARVEEEAKVCPALTAAASQGVAEGDMTGGPVENTPLRAVSRDVLRPLILDLHDAGAPERVACCGFREADSAYERARRLSHHDLWRLFYALPPQVTEEQCRRFVVDARATMMHLERTCPFSDILRGEYGRSFGVICMCTGRRIFAHFARMERSVDPKTENGPSIDRAEVEDAIEELLTAINAAIPKKWRHKKVAIRALTNIHLDGFSKMLLRYCPLQFKTDLDFIPLEDFTHAMSDPAQRNPLPTAQERWMMEEVAARLNSLMTKMKRRLPSSPREAPSPGMLTRWQVIEALGGLRHGIAEQISLLPDRPRGKTPQLVAFTALFGVRSMVVLGCSDPLRSPLNLQPVRDGLQLIVTGAKIAYQTAYEKDASLIIARTIEESLTALEQRFIVPESTTLQAAAGAPHDGAISAQEVATARDAAISDDVGSGIRTEKAQATVPQKTLAQWWQAVKKSAKDRLGSTVEHAKVTPEECRGSVLALLPALPSVRGGALDSRKKCTAFIAALRKGIQDVHETCDIGGVTVHVPDALRSFLLGQVAHMEEDLLARWLPERDGAEGELPASDPLSSALEFVMTEELQGAQDALHILTDAVAAPVGNLAAQFLHRLVARGEPLEEAGLRVEAAAAAADRAVDAALQAICVNGPPTFAALKKAVQSVDERVDLSATGLSPEDQERFRREVLGRAAAMIAAAQDPLDVLIPEQAVEASGSKADGDQPVVLADGDAALASGSRSRRRVKEAVTRIDRARRLERAGYAQTHANQADSLLSGLHARCVALLAQAQDDRDPHAQADAQEQLAAVPHILHALLSQFGQPHP